MWGSQQKQNVSLYRDGLCFIKSKAHYYFMYHEKKGKMCQLHWHVAFLLSAVRHIPIWELWKCVCASRGKGPLTMDFLNDLRKNLCTGCCELIFWNSSPQLCGHQGPFSWKTIFPWTGVGEWETGGRAQTVIRAVSTDWEEGGWGPLFWKMVHLKETEVVLQPGSLSWPRHLVGW